MSEPANTPAAAAPPAAAPPASQPPPGNGGGSSGDQEEAVWTRIDKMIDEKLSGILDKRLEFLGPKDDPANPPAPTPPAPGADPPPGKGNSLNKILGLG